MPIADLRSDIARLAGQQGGRSALRGLLSRVLINTGLHAGGLAPSGHQPFYRLLPFRTIRLQTRCNKEAVKNG
ncbi:MAG: hypothetical protein DME58_07155 [Verrucomicrobia bacterium]|nr:MAG: hypothetical protein DME58_07155 [Verrucomicrobiota bacterium]PYL12126.1 MAG: hypothetical protein DMF48_03380 [Verrucomicrobiota bacterium]PYL21040.1 MAG: hypothetical protein DMF44_13895 [Verrucomicrobiota bacterium]